MKKKIIALVTVIIMATNSFIFICAEETSEMNEINYMMSQLEIEQEVFKAENNISDIPITQEILDDIKAYVVDTSTGEATSLDVCATIKIVGQTRNGQGTIYSLTATNKTSMGDKELSGVKAIGTIYWIDNLGTNNKLLSVEGGWLKDLNYTGHKAINKVVEYGFNPNNHGPGAIAQNSTKYPSDGSWAFNYSKSLTGSSFYLETVADVKNNSMSDYKTLKLTVATSIWD